MPIKVPTPFKPNLLASLTLLAEVGVGNSPSMAGSEPHQSSNGRKTPCKDRPAGEKVVDLEKLNDWRQLHVYMTGGAAASNGCCATVQCMSGTSHYTDSHIQCYSYVHCNVYIIVFNLQ